MDPSPYSFSGRLPTEEEATAFLANHDADNRDKAIDALLASTDYADYFAGKWTAMLKNRRDDTSDRVAKFAFHAWVRDSLLANKPTISLSASCWRPGTSA